MDQMRRRVTDTPRANRRTADDDGDNHSDHDGDHDGYNHPSPFIFILLLAFVSSTVMDVMIAKCRSETLQGLHGSWPPRRNVNRCESLDGSGRRVINSRNGFVVS
jgi:hypothetical protein